jgi:MerR family transcriptional regulator, heat shock protein HspR
LAASAVGIGYRPLDNGIVNVLASECVRLEPKSCRPRLSGISRGTETIVSVGRTERDSTRPVYVISVAAGIVSVHPRTLRIYEDEGLVCPARTPTNIRLYSEDDIRRILWIRHLTRDRGVNLAGIRLLFELEERLGARILEALYDEGIAARESTADDDRTTTRTSEPTTGSPAATPRRA